MTLGERIKECRQNSGLSQDKVAELVGVSRQAVTKWEAGQTAPNTENLFKLAEIFGTTVDMLVATDDATKQSPAEQIYYLYKMEEEKKAGERRTNHKKNFFVAGCIIAAYLLIYLLMQIIFGDTQNSSLIGILISTSSKSYLWGWLLHNKIFWIVLCIAVIPVLFGKWRFAITTSVMFFLGILNGELFGPYPAGAAYGHDHYGWAIWGGMYLVSIVMGIIAERMKKHGTPIKSKKSAIWLAVTFVCCIAVVLLILLSRPDYSTM